MPPASACSIGEKQPPLFGSPVRLNEKKIELLKQKFHLLNFLHAQTNGPQPATEPHTQPETTQARANGCLI